MSSDVAARPPLVFDSATHIGSVNGVVWPSITQLLRDAAIVNGDWYTESARERGSAVHHWLQLLDLLVCGIDDVPERWRGYARQYVSFRDREIAEIHLNEEQLVNYELRYFGTPDRIVTYRRHATIIEIKTGFPDDFHAIQVAGQALLRPDPWRYRRGALYLDGSAKPPKLAMFEERSDFDVFKAALTVSWFKRRTA